MQDFVESKGYLTSFTETDPTVPAWAKAPNKPTYTASEIGAYVKPANGIPAEDIASSIIADINNKVDKVSGKELSTNDYTTEEKTKLSGIAAGAEVNV